VREDEQHRGEGQPGEIAFKNWQPGGCFELVKKSGHDFVPGLLNKKKLYHMNICHCI